MLFFIGAHNLLLVLNHSEVMSSSCQGFNPLKLGWSHRAPVPFFFSIQSWVMSHWASSHANGLSQATCQILVEWQWGVLPLCLIILKWKGQIIIARSGTWMYWQLLYSQSWVFICSITVTCLSEEYEGDGMIECQFKVLLIDSVSCVTVKY